MSETVKAKTQWVWTEKAVKLNSYEKLPGAPIWENYRKKAPTRWLEEGLIEESGQENLPEGQAAFDF